MVWGVGTTAKEVAEYEGLIAKAENNPDAQAAKQGLASQALRGALKWGGPVHSAPSELLTGSGKVPVTVAGSTMPIYKGLETPFDPTKPFTDKAQALKWGGSAVFASPSEEVAKIFAGPFQWGNAPPPPGTLIKGVLPTKEWIKGVHIDKANQAHQILLDAQNANKVFGQGSTTAKSIPVPRINKFALPFDPEMARFPASTKVLGTAARLAPGAGIALGAYDTQRRFRQGDYLGAGLGAVSMVPGPIGWAGLGTQALYDLASWYLSD